MRRLKYLLFFILGTVTLAVLGWSLLNYYFPLPSEYTKSHSVNVVSSEGETLRQFADEQGIFRIPVTTQYVSDVYLNTLLNYEDQRFFSHVGFDWRALIRALIQRISSGKIISGGSTLTMQVVRILYPVERTYLGKIVQIYRALQLEHQLSKEDILSLYLTFAPMGGNIEGVEAASQRYLGKSANELNLSDAALLSVIPQRPSVYRPDRYPQKAMAARNKVLRRLMANGLLTSDEYFLLKDEPVRPARQPIKRSVPLLARELKRKYSGLDVIETYIDDQLQKNLNSIAKTRFESLYGRLSVAIIVLENASGKVLGYKGSLDIDNKRSYGHVDMTKAIRSPGSTLKPFIYGAALEQGMIHSQSLLMDIPMSFSGYRPQNFDKVFSGAISATEALQRSKNIPPVYLLDKLGVESFVKKMEILGASLRLPDSNLSLALGGGGSTLRELVMFYSSLNRGGKSVLPRFTPHDLMLVEQLLSRESAWIVRTMLQTPPVDRPILKYNRSVAWKTGTSFGFRDAWAIGTSTDYTVGVWVGRPDGSPYVGQTGASMASPLLFDVFDLLPNDIGRREKPSRVEPVKICWPSGLNKKVVLADHCLMELTAWSIGGVTPWTLRKHMHSNNLHQWPQKLEAWNRHSTKNNKDFEIVFPKNGSHIYPYPDQTFEFKSSNRRVRWFINNAPSSNTVDAHSLKGEQKIKACNHLKCEQITFFVH
ncbi:penicillin-binding protein 1C [Vibrio ostreicida]|uniref:peptidoglycan glycosyltransferase n=1 Tax=Vibrio ostreicida TaxID=526588 RepID=A0ABT8BYT1_9VIBR|nr:penicillin-binding protein 1C [Vibrio ostreicida]MDN3611833.1 penicillin-binding protein 1C [Vibrio ostreicida]NPD09646.1 penicillin-binding protein 1C [Vibrio ostreicida]